MQHNWIINKSDLVLITGANGFIGSRVAHTLLSYGFKHVKCLTRPTSNSKNLGEYDIIDEVRVIIQDEDSMTAYFTFSSQIKPVPHQLSLYGRKNSINVDDDHQVLIKVREIMLTSKIMDEIFAQIKRRNSPACDS